MAETIGALNNAVAKGYTRHIGVSNFTVPLLREAIEVSERSLVCNQIEYHPMLNQDKLLGACRESDMAVVSYCPLFRGGELFANDPVASLARKHSRTPAQIVLRWQIQQDKVIAIPRSTNTGRIEENLAVFDFELSTEEMEEISALGVNGTRLCDFEFSPQWDS